LCEKNIVSESCATTWPREDTDLEKRPSNIFTSLYYRAVRREEKKQGVFQLQI